MASCPVFSKCFIPTLPWKDHYHHHDNSIYHRGIDVGTKYRASKNGRVHMSQKKFGEPGKMDEHKLHCNAHRAKQNNLWTGGFSLGIDLGDARTGVALGKGYAQPRPLSVLQLRGQKLECRLIELAEKEEVDEFIVGLPKSSDGKETPQSNKVRSIAGRLAVRAAERGWRVYLQNEHGTSADALDFMIEIGLKRRARQEQSDAYAAVKSVLQQNPEGYYRRKGYDMTARSSGPLSWSGYNALFDLKETKPTVRRTKPADEVEELHRSKLSSHHVFSVRRAKHPRKSSSEYSLATVQSTQSENEASSVTKSQEVEQSDQDIRSNCFRDANANGSCCYKNIVIQPKTAFQGLEPSYIMQNSNLPEIKEQKGASKSKGTLKEESGNGSTSSEWDEGRSNVEAGREIVTVGMTEREFRSSSRRRCLHHSLKLTTMGIGSKRDDIEARTIAWQEPAKTAKALNRLKREESLIAAWESKQRAKADIHMTKVERRLEEKRVKEWEKTQNKIARAHRKAEQRKAAQRAKINPETSRVTSMVDKIKSAGKLPWKFHFF